MLRAMDRQLKHSSPLFYSQLKLNVKRLAHGFGIKYIAGRGPKEVLLRLMHVLARDYGFANLKMIIITVIRTIGNNFISEFILMGIVTIIRGISGGIQPLIHTFGYNYPIFPSIPMSMQHRIKNKTQTVKVFNLNKKSMLVQKGQIYFGKTYQQMPIVYNANKLNCLASIHTRNLPAKIGHSDGLVKAFGRFYLTKVKKNIKMIYDVETDNISYNMAEYIKNLPSDKKKLMKVALSEYLECKPYTKKFKAMSKTQKEEQNADGKIHEPRTISFQNVMNRLLLGPFIREIEKVYKKHLHGYEDLGNYQTTADIMTKVEGTFPYPIYTWVSGDFSKYDRSVDKWMWELAAVLYQMFLEIIDCTMAVDGFYEYSLVSEWLITNRVLVINDITLMMSFSLQGQMASGNSNTNEANTLRNILLYFFVFECANIKFNYFKDDSVLSMYNNPNPDVYFIGKGDDHTFKVISSKLSLCLKTISEVFHQEKGLGYTIKEMYVGSVESVEFLSLRFVSRPDKTVFVVKPLRRFLQQVSWSCDKLSIKEHVKMRKMMYCEGVSLGKAFGKLPIFKEISNVMITHGIKTDQFFDTSDMFWKIRGDQCLRDSDAELYIQYLADVYSVSSQMVTKFCDDIKQSHYLGIIYSEFIDILWLGEQVLGDLFNPIDGTISEGPIRTFSKPSHIIRNENNTLVDVMFVSDINEFSALNYDPDSMHLYNTYVNEIN